MPESERNEEAIFETARQLATPEARRGYLAEACGADVELRRRVEELLEAEAGADEIFKTAITSRPARPGGTAVIPITEKAGDRIGRYKLLQKIGEGGCGVVYMAEQEQPVRRRVALKVIKLGMDTRSVIARFEAERQALALMDHPNIAKVLEAGATEAGRPYFVMELVKGVRITEYCDENNLATADRLDLFTKVCAAIHHAHQKGIIHRDIKPSNILVTLHDGAPVPKVIDFGIAKATDQRLTDKTLFTAFEQFIGTPAYMSPEQAEMSGLDIDTRSDVYSLGVLLYELLTGRTPFDAQELFAAGLDEMRRTIREQEPARPSTRLSTLAEADRTTVARHRRTESTKLTALLRGDLDWIVMKALEKDRTRRYDTASSLAQDIARHRHNEPVMARPPSTLYRLRKMVRRHRVAFAAGTLVAAALILGLGVSTWMFLRERKAREAARKAAIEQIALRKLAEANAKETRQLLYVADMGAAFQALEASNFGRAQELLQRHVPDAGEADWRGFEWRHLAFRARDQSRLVLSHPEGVFGATFSPDGRSAVTVARDSKLRVWDLTTKQVVRTMDEVACAYGSDRPLFSPEGRWLAVRHRDKATIFDTGQAAWPVAYAGSNITTGFQFSGDGTRFFDATVSNTLEVVRLRDWTVTSAPALFENEPWLAMASEPRRASLAIWNGGKLVRFDAEEMKFSSPYSNVSHTAMSGGNIGALAWSPRNLLAAGTRFFGGNLFAWDAGADTLRLNTNAHADGIFALAFNPAGDVLATASHDQKIILWAMPSGRRLATLLGHQRMVLSVAFSADGKSLITSGADKTVRIWDVSDRRGLPDLMEMPDGARFTADSRYVISLGRENFRESVEKSPWIISRDDVHRPGRMERTPLPDSTSETLIHPEAEAPQTHGHTGISFYAGTLSPNARVIGRMTDKGILELFDIATQAWNRRHDFGQALLTFEFSPVGETIAVARQDQRVDLWDWNQDQTRTLPITLGGDVRMLRFVPGGRQLYLSDGRKNRCLVDLNGQNRIDVADHPSESFSFSSDGNFMAMPDFQRRCLRVLELPTGREVCVIARDETGLSESEPSFSAVSAGGEWVALSDTQATVSLWSTRTGRKVGVPMKGHLGAISGLMFSPDSRLLVSTSWDQTARLWHVATQRELTSFKDCMGPRFSPDGQTLMLWTRAEGRIFLHAPGLEEIAR